MDSVGKVHSVDSSSPEEINNLCAQLGWDCYFTQFDTGPLSGSCLLRNWEGVNTLNVSISVAACVRLACLPGYVVLGNLLSETPAKINGLDLDSNNFFILMPGSNFCVTTMGPVTIHVALISKSGFGTKLADACHAIGKRFIDVAVIRSGIDEQADQFKNWYLHWLSNPYSHDAKIQKYLSQQIKEVLHSMLKRIDEDRAVDADRYLNGKMEDSNHRILELIDHFYQNLELPYTTAEMLAIAGMNRRSFFYHFKNFTGYSPHHFFRYIRLQAVRQELLAKTDNVTELAEKFHFHHHGEFSELYRKTYGELPSETRQKTLARYSGTA